MTHPRLNIYIILVVTKLTHSPFSKQLIAAERIIDDTRVIRRISKIRGRARAERRIFLVESIS